jgi:riboflavin kinase / FMN adenylyltransferase
MNDMQPVTLSGIVTRFKGDGRRLGYPTANLVIDTDLKDGVYFGFADLDKWLKQPALIFIGTPDTMGETDHRVEAYLLDIPDKDYYDLPLKLTIKYFHRGNQKFSDVKELLKAMKADETAALYWFSLHGFPETT